MSRARSVLRVCMAVWALSFTLGAHAGNTYKMKQVAYVEPEPPGPEETLVYVFRENSSLGALRKFAIIDNDTVVGVLTPGTFTHFNVPTGQHEIVAYEAPSPLVHYRVMPSPGKIVYLYCKVGYASGLYMEPIDEAQAKEMIQKFKMTEIEVKDQKAKMNYMDYYDKLYQ